MEKQKFETWIISQFGKHIENKLAQFDEEDGYHDEVINAMWIGFNAGLLLAE
ncbi:hypothetical protein [Vibrio vulnificus]|uniref:hypothetical protein n=1 Tax=Vibrio vulnificus TaxID=672 RepID=UPI001FAEF650|nr:hypothetical protein [Vibrio vulnificus]MCJ0814930.1 hypothetical protein [Vibrio vulnificus]